MCPSKELKVKINTIPRKGPFRVFQIVQFSCEVEPAQLDNLSYQWKNIENVFGGSNFTEESFNTTLTKDNLRYCWYFCTVYGSNGAVLGSANRLIEVHGKCLATCMISQYKIFLEFYNIIVSIFHASFITPLAPHAGTCIYILIFLPFFMDMFYLGRKT